jgi:hypothetical protein
VCLPSSFGRRRDKERAGAKRQTSSHHPSSIHGMRSSPLASLYRSQHLLNRVRRSSCALGTTDFHGQGQEPVHNHCPVRRSTNAAATARMTLQSGAKPTAAVARDPSGGERNGREGRAKTKKKKREHPIMRLAILRRPSSYKNGSILG